MNSTTNQELWERVLGEVKTIVSNANFNTWFQKTSLKDTKDGIVWINVPNSFTKEWLKNKYDKFLLGILRKIDPSTKIVEYVIYSQPQNEPEKSISKFKIPFSEKEEVPQLEFNDFYKSEDSLNPRYTFENFIVGSFNELAHATAVAVTNNPGTVYNPLFIYGGVGLGKTHLIQAIGNKIKEGLKNSKIRYTTSEKFANELIQSIQNNKTYEFKENYKKYDVLIIDDIQFLSGKTKTQEEFFHVFNTLYEKNKQIIFSSDRPPRSIPDLEERLRSRFEGGTMADISEPELEARIAILKSKAQFKNIDLSGDIEEYIATAVKNNIRELEGVLNLISAKSKLLNKNLSIQEIKDLIDKNLIYTRKKVTFTKIIKVVADFYETPEESLFEKSRKKEFVVPRQIAMYLLREDFNGSYPYIGQKFGGRDHTTVIHAYEKVSNDIKKDQQLKTDIQKIRDLLYK
ncbi:MAG: chromosomal replication initiator protein DnaA [Candidatus Pacebacteria bacterium]|nr:chromosomal replication initiator protein DnaA [Candidatus Paceibacterota bacterium]